MIRTLSLLMLAGLFAVTTAVAQDAPATKKAPAKKRPPNPAMAQIEDKPGLPRVLLIGDSISIGYTIPVREELKGVANVHRPRTNCGPTTRGVDQIDAWLGEGKWDVIHFNFGLHDLVCMDANGKRVSPTDGKPQVPLADYAKNLETLVARLKKTDAKLIFATTTPVPAGEPIRIPDSDKEYNEVALKVMKTHDIAIDDLNGFVRSRKAEGMLPHNVHFTPAGSKALAGQVANSIKAALGKD